MSPWVSRLSLTAGEQYARIEEGRKRHRDRLLLYLIDAGVHPHSQGSPRPHLDVASGSTPASSTTRHDDNGTGFCAACDARTARTRAPILDLIKVSLFERLLQNGFEPATIGLEGYSDLCTKASTANFTHCLCVMSRYQRHATSIRTMTGPMARRVVNSPGRTWPTSSRPSSEPRGDTVSHPITPPVGHHVATRAPGPRRSSPSAGVGRFGTFRLRAELQTGGWQCKTSSISERNYLARRSPSPDRPAGSQPGDCARPSETDLGGQSRAGEQG